MYSVAFFNKSHSQEESESVLQVNLKGPKKLEIGPCDTFSPTC